VNARIVAEQSFFVSMVKVCTMVDSGLLRGCAAKYLWLPCISEKLSVSAYDICRSGVVQMGVKVDNGDGSVSL
jgi:hypothetical protein